MHTPKMATGGKVRRFAHFGTFDVENYGDLLFPLILERRLADTAVEWVHVSPVGGGPVWGDCVSTISTRQAMNEKFDGVIVGGGHIIHGQASDVAPYVMSGDIGLFAYADLWLGATLLASELNIPIVWNAPGVPGTLASETAALAKWAASEAAYLALRDPQSRAFLASTGFDGDIAVELDTALEVDHLWSSAELDAASKEAFASRHSERSHRSIAVHFTSRYLQDGVEETARRLDNLCRAHKATAILLALGPCHGDAKLQTEIGGKMETTPLVIDRPQSLREIAACIRDSEFFLGSSLHGAITAVAFGRPAIIVAQEAEGGHAKFTGFLESQCCSANPTATPDALIVTSWKKGFAKARASSARPEWQSNGEMTSAKNLHALERHWERLSKALFRNSDDAVYRQAKKAGRDRLESLVGKFAPHPIAYRGILLDQARAAGRFRETSQKNARRFRELDRAYRDLRISQ
jgi:polysaccharide pyruvyl transferase WcaK-like protein